MFVPWLVTDYGVNTGLNTTQKVNLHKILYLSLKQNVNAYHFKIISSFNNI